MNSPYYPIGEFTESVRVANLYLGILIMIIIIKIKRRFPESDGEAPDNREHA